MFLFDNSKIHGDDDMMFLIIQVPQQIKCAPGTPCYAQQIAMIGQLCFIEMLEKSIIAITKIPTYSISLHPVDWK